MDEPAKKALIRAALVAREKAYAPYSGFAVGAALLGKSGKVYTGCNVECAAFSPTSCAERTALCKAVSEGERTFEAIAVAGGRMNVRGTLPLTTPCGVCRQMLYEFGGGALCVLLARDEEIWQETTLEELLPMGFGPSDLA